MATALWMVEKFIGDQTGETLQNLLSGVLRKPSIEWDTRPQNSLRSYPVGCQGSHPPILALYYEASCGDCPRSHSQGGAQGSYPQRAPLLLATWHCRKSYAHCRSLMSKATGTTKRSPFFSRCPFRTLY